MAKVRAPLFSFGASGKLAKSLVYFGWKGLNVVRSYVIPANPKSADQVIQRNYLKAAVAAIHTAQALAVQGLADIDKSAYALLGSLQATPRTWFNTACKAWIDQYVKGLHGAIYRGGISAEADMFLTTTVFFTDEGPNGITAGDFWYGTKKTALLSSKVAAIGPADAASCNIVGLTNGVLYYWQFRPTAHVDYVGMNSGIYHGTPHA